MTTADQSHASPPSVMPWPAAVAAIISFAALFFTGNRIPTVPVIGCALLLTYWIPYRMPSSSPLPWIARCAVFGILIAANPETSNPEQYGANTFFDPRTVSVFGQMVAAELVIQMWKRRPDGGMRGGAAILLSGIVFLAASNTTSVVFIPVLAPLYMLFLGLAMRAYRLRQLSRHMPESRRVPLLIPVASVFLALAFGSSLYLYFYRHRVELTSVGGRYGRYLQDFGADQLSTAPILTATYGQSGSTVRALRIVGPLYENHIRLMSFVNYRLNTWGPTETKRDMGTADATLLHATAQGVRTRITRLRDSDANVYAPLHVAGVDIGTDPDAQWNSDMGPVETGSTAADYYDIISSEDENYQGPLCAPLDRPGVRADTRRMGECLAVPPDLRESLRPMVEQIGTGISTPEQRIAAVERYLMTHHRYSLRYSPGRGDALKNFLLSDRGAHCEYFASAAVILLRLLNVPSRYVIGFYAHEQAAPGVTVVRYRDAHAWAESWIAGKGWVTVDATPGGGRPDAFSRTVPLPQRVWEWIQDGIQTAQEWVGGLSRAQLSELLVSIAVLLLLPSFWRMLRRGNPAVAPVHALLPDGPDMAALARGFEESLAQRKAPCAPGTPWKEHLEHLDLQLEMPPAMREAAMEFVTLYNRLRFGHEGDEETLNRLRGILRMLNEKNAETAPSDSAQEKRNDR